VRLQPSENGWTLAVVDDGVGLAAELVRAAKPRSGLGTRLVMAFVEGLGATIATTAEPGLRHEIAFRP